MAVNRAPKQWALTREETITSFEGWRQNLVYILSLDANFLPFLSDNATWQKKTSLTPTRGLEDDPNTVQQDRRLSAAQKNARLELMLGQIANYCPVISRSSIVKGSTSLNDIWQKIRQHYGFESSGSHFLDLANIKYTPDERPEDLFQRLMAFFEDNLLTTSGGITHHGEQVRVDEDLSPTLENTIVVIWLQLIHPGLPLLVRQKYGAELRNRTLASVKVEISQALNSLLDELRSMEESKAFRAGVSSKFPPKKRQFKSCILCKTANRPGATSHNLQDCKYLPEYDRRRLARSRLVTDEELNEECDEPSEDILPPDEDSALFDNNAVRRVSIIQSPVLHTYYGPHHVKLTLDTGATTNMVHSDFARRARLPILPASQMARQADGVTPLVVLGEVHCELTRDGDTFALDALVVDKLDVDVLAGTPFLTKNDVATRPAKRQVVINGTKVVYYGQQPQNNTAVRRTQAYLVRCPSRQTTVLPGEYVELAVPECSDFDSTWALEPRLDSTANLKASPAAAWPPPQEITAVGRSIRVTNETREAIVLKRHEHIGQLRPIHTIQEPATNQSACMASRPQVHQSETPAQPHSTNVQVDPDNILTQAERDRFTDIHRGHDVVFNPRISKYNSHSGNIEAVVNMGPTLPPQRKARLPHYNRDMMLKLQDKFDALESVGVFARPEDIGVHVEYLNLSFLVGKPNGDFRLVTSFGEVAKYSKPQPSLMPNVDGVLRDIARWKFIIVSDLLQAFYQIPLSRKSMKYCGVATPYKGIRVYTRSAMGMPGSETCLEELMSRVLGELVREGCVAKLADDLYCGGDTIDDLAHNWSRVLEALEHNDLRLSASKTIVCPRTTNILGWIWSAGTLRASPHKLTALSTVEPPPTVQGLRSFIGAYKVLSRVLSGYADLLHPLESVTAGKESRSKIEWSDDLVSSFKLAQSALSQCKVITLPRPGDLLWIVTDGSVKQQGIGATLYILRGEELALAGFFNAKLKKHQVTWLPCEIEALCIGAAVRHFAPYIIQSRKRTQVLTDSRPCVQAYEKLQRGEFSNSSRVTSFLSTVSRYLVQVSHVSGAANLPSDYTSRNPAVCPERSCQICRFIDELGDSVVRGITVTDVLDGTFKMPFTNRTAWLATQQECPDLRRTHAHLSQGTRPTKKSTKIPDVKRYIRQTAVARDGLIVVKETSAFHQPRERIVVPRSVLDGILTALHLKFQHPSRHQLGLVFNRFFFALDTDRGLDTVTSACHHCAALLRIPPHLNEQSTSAPPDKIGCHFAVDIMRRYGQFVMVLRECVSSYTRTLFVEGERHEQLRDGLLILCSDLTSLGDEGATVRADKASGFTALVNDKLLAKHGIKLEIGNPKNPNKNPVGERAVEELGIECLKHSPEGGPLTKVSLALITASLNSRIRREGLSAREVWTQRDQLTGNQLPVDDREVILNQHQSRVQNHSSSAKSKAQVQQTFPTDCLKVGSLVYVIREGDKTKARDKYIISAIEGSTCSIRKFTRDQLRSASYTVPLSDCFPVKTDVPTPHGPIRGLDHPNADASDNLPESHCDRLLHAAPTELNHMPNLPVTPPLIVREPPSPPKPIPPPEIVIPPLQTPTTPAPAATPPTPAMAPSSPATIVGADTAPARTSGRQRRPPAWQSDPDWDMS